MLNIYFFWNGTNKTILKTTMSSPPRTGEMVRISPERPGAAPRFGVVVLVVWRVEFNEVDVKLKPCEAPA